MVDWWLWLICPEKRRTVSDGWDSIQGLAWSADGNEIWFTATRTGGDRSLYATNLSGKVRLLARLPGELTILDVRQRRECSSDARERPRGDHGFGTR